MAINVRVKYILKLFETYFKTNNKEKEKRTKMVND